MKLIWGLMVRGFYTKIGIVLTDIDELYFTELNNCGETRSNSAHHSKGIRNLIDYSTLKTRIQRVKILFNILDEKLSE